MKICRCCKIEKSIDHFFKRLASKDGHYHQCRSCQTVLGTYGIVLAKRWKYGYA